MKDKHQYNTRRRAELLEYLKSMQGRHVTVNDIRAHFLAKGESIGTATIYRQLDKLKKHYAAILVGVFSGVLASGLSIFAMSALFGLSHTDYVTLLPKSVTTAIGMSLSEELGGIAAVTVASIVLTGILGNCMAPFLCRLFKVAHPVARGIAIGTASHALGTSKAIEMGEIEGAMSGLSIAVAGLMTVAAAQVFALLW